MTRAAGLLEHPPTPEELLRLYHELSLVGAKAVGRFEQWPYEPRGLEQLLVLSAEMLRYDPRLLSILLELVLSRWTQLNPLLLRGELGRMRWPQALLVVFEFARAASTEAELHYLCRYLAAGFDRVNPAERFFLDVERPASRTARRRAGRNLTAYKRWGFIGTERPTTSVFTKRLVGTYDAASRGHVRRQLAKHHGSFTVSEYLDALDHAISRQQAYKDLRSDPSLLLEGHGRGARWVAAR